MTKAQASRVVSILSASGLSSKTITDVIVTYHGSVVVIEVVESGGSHFIKERGDVVEVGGTLDWGTGTIV